MRRLSATLAALLAIAAIAALGVASTQWHTALDLTHAGRHRLSVASIDVLRSLTAPIAIEAYLPSGHPARARVRLLVERYRRHKPDISLRFIDLADLSAQGQAGGAPAEARREGELHIDYEGRGKNVDALTEQAVTGALAQLYRGSEDWLAVIAGHGERSPTRGANHDLSQWAAHLSERGLKAQELKLADVGALPDNTSVAIIASPRVAYLPAEVGALLAYLERGGNLLWLLEPDSDASLGALEKYLGFGRVPGTLIDPATIRYNIDNPAITTVTRYGAHAAIDQFNLITVFPFAAGLHLRGAPGWRQMAILETDERAWSETATLEGNVGFDAGADFPGPHRIGVALERDRGENQPAQRVVVIGDGDFLANQYIGNGGNLDLGLRLVEWLAQDDQLISVPPVRAFDTQLEFTRWQIIVFGFGFLVALPGLFVLNALAIWRRRNRA